ncbi:alcohol dehydrogenase, class IV [Clostridium aceticum]|uniref:Alcohol dehydrogenase, class IV n=1 Tax=Clostridium aceticum TaxID=84022 RepID=A0A0D8I7P8_9CLOT|nr:iron-containing alcohol dehydrogenase [Clostridium aceticum]AKL97291.1 alcohol dehydrogenase, class IV [Clostridium aceticum]KJF26310.1 1,3-propanediol dehydrogenase [Clostridium aceticum]
MLKSGVYTQLAPILFGNGTSQQAGKKAKDLNMTKVLLVTDKGVLDTGHAEKVVNVLKAEGIDVVMWDGVETDCPDYTVAAAAAIGREKAVDSIIGVGGGSVLDTAKAIAAVIPNGDGVLQEIVLYLTGQKRYAVQPLPLMLIPTTAGTGSESTFVSVVSSETMQCKIGLPCPPNYGIVDPELTVGSPAFITAFAGMDAFSHASEALTEVKNTPHSDLLAYEAIRLISKWLPIAVKDINNLEARENLALASNFAGIAFNESGVHMGHSTAHALGHMYHIPHGICCALVTPPIIEFSAKAYPEKMKKIGEIMGLSFSPETPENIGKIVGNAVRVLCKEIGIPSLKEQGLTKEQVLAAKPMIYQEPLCMTFDGTITEQDVITLLETLYDDYQ